MLNDRYGSALSTASAASRDADIAGVVLVLSGNFGAQETFQRSVEADKAFALGYAGLARAAQVSTQAPAAQESIAKAKAEAGKASKRENIHIAAMSLLIAGDGAGAPKSRRPPADEHSRDVLVIQPVTSVFYLPGFSGLAGA
jgi:hypothetical protein